MNEENSFLLKVEKLVNPSTGPFRKFRWAQPSEDHLRELLHYVKDHPDEAKAKGIKAREEMLKKYSIPKVTKLVLEQLKTVQKKMENKIRTTTTTKSLISTEH